MTTCLLVRALQAITLRRWSWLVQRPVLSTGQTSDLRLERQGLRYWTSKCGVAEGEPSNYKVSVEAFDGMRWVDAIVYDGKTLQILSYPSGKSAGAGEK